MRTSARIALLALALALLAALAVPTIAAAAVTLPDGFQQRVALSGLVQPTAVRFAPNSDLVFVTEKRGTIQVFDGLGDTTPSQVINLRSEVYNNGDRGLLGLETDPDFPTRPYLYVSYSRDASFAASTGSVPSEDAPWHQPDATADSADDDPDCGGQLYMEAGCPISGRLVRIEVNPVTGVKVAGTPPNPKPLVSGWCQQFSTHSLGDLRFGADHELYVSAGDGAGYETVDAGQFPDGGPSPCPDASNEGGAMRAQDSRTPADPTALNGAILRVDPDTGAASPGNPNLTGDENQHRIIGFGLRNPYRMTFRPGTNDLWLGDVGWSRWEEIDRIDNATPDAMAPAQNFGWPCYEGDWEDNTVNGPYRDYSPALPLCQSLYAFPYPPGPPVTAPFFSYYHTQVEGQCFPTQFRADYSDSSTPYAGAAITGLSFYNGGDYPDGYDGGLFFGDYARGCLWFMAATDGIPDPMKVQEFAAWDPGSYAPGGAAPDIGIVGLERGPGGDIFVTDLANGAVRRLMYGVDARLSASVTSGSNPLPVTFDASESKGFAGAPIVRYEWDLDGDGTFERDTGTTPTTATSYPDPGVTDVKVRVTDAGGRTGVSDAVKIEAGDPPTALITSPNPGAPLWKVGDQFTFAGKGFDTASNELATTSLTWDLVIRHCTTSGDCHSHFVGGSLSGLDGGRHGGAGTFFAPDHSYPSHLELRLTVKDANGLTATATRRLDPQTVQIALASDPTGRTLTANDKSAAAPFICTVIKGSQTTVSATPSETAGGQLFSFASWSNGRPATQTFTATADQALTARYSTAALPAQLPGPPAAPAKLAAAKAPVVRRGGTLAVSRDGSLKLLVRCPGPGNCRASVTLDTVSASGAKTRRLARRFVKRVRAGRTVSLRVRLSANARRLLATRRSLSALATVTVTPAGRSPKVTRTRYTLRSPKR
jgi:glucose/arabinose dehydrogenase